MDEEIVDETPLFEDENIEPTEGETPLFEESTTPLTPSFSENEPKTNKEAEININLAPSNSQNKKIHNKRPESNNSENKDPNKKPVRRRRRKPPTNKPVEVNPIS